MSIKIHYGFRFPLSHINDGIDFFHDHMMNHVRKQYAELLKSVTEEGMKNRWVERHPHEAMPDDVKTRLYLRQSIVRDLLQEFHKTRDNPGDLLPMLECGFNLWVADEFVFLIPVGPDGFWHDLYKSEITLKDFVPPYIEEFHYQDQSERPKGIGEKKYQQRLATWESTCLGDHHTKQGWYARKLYHTVFEYPWTMCWLKFDDLESYVL